LKRQDAKNRLKMLAAKGATSVALGKETDYSVFHLY
jgi:hypothetical protein